MSSGAGAQLGRLRFGGIEDILGDLFGFGDVFGGGSRAGGSGVPPRSAAPDLRYDLEMALEESGGGDDGATAHPAPETCDNCKGSGAAKETQPEPFNVRRARTGALQQGFFSVARTCGTCRGTGRIIKAPCEECRGAGRVERERSLEVKVPAGVETGSRLRIAGEGESGTGGGPSGDLYVVIHVKEHEQFERQGSNLYSSVPVTFAQAALGAEITVETLGSQQQLKIPAGTQTGTVFRLKGNGMPVLGGRGRGDLFASATVVTPTTLTREQRRLLEQLFEIEDRDLQDTGLMDKVRNIFG